MVKVWRAGTEEPFEFAQADGAHENNGKLVLTRRKKEPRQPEVLRVIQAGSWALAEVYDRLGSRSETIGAIKPVSTRGLPAEKAGRTVKPK